jgi:hypothetical protein
MASGEGEDAEKAQQRKKQIKKMGKLLAKIWELDAGFHPDLMAVGTKIDQGSYSPGKAGWHEFCNHVGGIYQNHIIGYVAFHSFPVDGCRNYHNGTNRSFLSIVHNLTHSSVHTTFMAARPN